MHFKLFSHFSCTLNLFQICNNGMLTLNQVWREGYPTVFETDSWYNDKPIIAPYWAQSDEAIMELLADEYPDAQSKVYYQVYQKSSNMDRRTERILSKASQDVADHGEISEVSWSIARHQRHVECHNLQTFIKCPPPNVRRLKSSHYFNIFWEEFFPTI